MNSTQSFKRLGLVAVAVLAACLTPVSLRAQSVFRGRFTLPLDTRWGTTVLPAGSYSFTVQSATNSFLLSVRDERAQSVMLMASYGASEDKHSEGSHLIVVRQGEKATVRGLHLEPVGMTFYYPPPKSDRQFNVPAQQLIQHLQVSAAGK